MKPLLLALITFISFSLLAQDIETKQKASSFGKLEGPFLVPSIAQQLKEGTFVRPTISSTIKTAPPKRRGANKHVPGKGLPKGDDALVRNQVKATKLNGREPSLVFDAAVSNISVSDPTGAAGPNHFVGAWNMAFRIFDKAGNPLTDEASLATLFPGNAIGDPIVFYDAEADRFIITEFDGNPNGFNMAVCQGPDPVNDGWYIYTTGFETGQFPDYTKFSVWSDGYYVTANIGATDNVFSVEREEMLLGNEAQFVGFPLTGISTSGFYSPQFFHVTDDDLPAEGNATVVYLQDDAWQGIETDHLKVWTVNVDWEDLANSTISAPTEIETTPFISVFDGGSFSNVPQPSGPDQDVLQATIMNQAQFRKFSSYNSAIFNFVVDTDGSSDELAGIRWFELRQDDDGEPWSIYQEGTYISPYNDKHAFSGSMAMDRFGNIGMGYTTCNENESIAINYTGRFTNDPLGQMTVDETLIAQSTSDNPGNRLADYVHLTVDPANDKTFWHIAEYFVNNERTDVVGVFQIASDYINDVGVVDVFAPTDGILTDDETIAITVRNFGSKTQIDIPVSYQIDDGTVVSEIVTDSIPGASEIQYSFSVSGDFSIEGQSYSIMAATSLEGDEDNMNDTLVGFVTHLFANDIGVNNIVSPTSGTGLSDEETVTVSVMNYGGAEQSGFHVSYILNDSTPVIEEVADTLLSNNSMEYSFDTPADLQMIGDYSMVAYTSLPGDSDMSNDTSSSVVTHNFCQPESDCTEGDGIERLELSNIDNTSGCDPNGYGDYLDMIADVEMGPYNDLTITTGYGDQYVKVWIDYNDNFVFDTSEVVIDNYVIAEGEGSGEHIETIVLDIPYDVSLGEHIMRAKTSWNNPVPEDACEETTYGETEDYTLNISQTTGIINQINEPNDLIITKTSDNQFMLSFTPVELDETLIVTVHNISGQKLIQNRVQKRNGKYEFDFDMSYAKPGLYLVRLGSANYGKVKKIIVN